MKNGFPESIVCTYLYTISKYGYPPSAEKTPDYIIEMYEMGFKSIELEGIRKKHLNEMFHLRKDIQKVLIARSLLVPYFCVVLPGLSSPDQSVRDKNLIEFEKGCVVAQAFGSKGVLDNGPLPPYKFPDDIPVVRHYDEKIMQSAGLPDNLVWSDYWQNLIITYQKACDIAGRYGLTYSIHPCLGVLASSTDAWLHFAQAVDRPNFKFNLDTANQFLIKDNLVLSLLRLKDHIDYIHISDNSGIKVEHLQPGKGHINWDAFFDTLAKINFSGHIGIDVGGEESPVEDIDGVYKETANWLMSKLSFIKQTRSHINDFI